MTVSRRRVTIIVALFCLWIGMSSQANAELARVALVIGNSTYALGGSLKHARDDADLVGAKLRSIGFSVISVTDLDRANFVRQVEAFGKLANSADIALVYYAGYAVTVDGENYLVPVEAKLAKRDDAALECLSLTKLRAAIAGARKLRLVMLDARHTNSFPLADKNGTRGTTRSLASPEIVSNNELVVYSARDGTVASDGESGNNSPFANAFAEALAEPSTDVWLLLRRVRDSVSSATDKEQEMIAFGSLGREQVLLIPDTTDEAEAAWEEVAGTKDVRILEEYLQKYPNSMFAEIATMSIKMLETRSEVGTERVKDLPALSEVLPSFPWPPPAASSQYRLPEALLGKLATIGDISDRITSVLDDRGYSERSYYLAGNGGIVLATRLERIDENGAPATGVERWRSGATGASDGIAAFLSNLFYADPGYYRVILFVVGGKPFRVGNRTPTEAEAFDWLESGPSGLPVAVANRAFDTKEGCTVLVYEFVSEDRALEAKIVRPGRLPAKQHLEASGVLALLGSTP